MPVCTNCNNSWSWIEVVKKSFILKNSLTCLHCGAEQYPTARTKKMTSLISFCGLTLIMGMNIFLGPSWVFFFALLLLFLIFLATYPFILKLSNKEEPLW